MNKDVLSLFLVWSLAFFSFGQEGSGVLEWRPPLLAEIDAEQPSVLYFEGAQFLKWDDRVPVWTDRVALSGHAAFVEVRLQNIRTSELSREELEVLQGIEISEDFKVEAFPTTWRGSPYAKVIVHPVRRDPLSGRIEKLTGFDYQLVFTPRPLGRSAQAFASQSVLSQGQWVKVGIVKDGLYKIDRDLLSDMGFDVSGLDPRNLRIYGNGGGMLPENTSDFRYDDLQENAIEVVGESDGSMDASDFILFYAEGPHSWKLQGDRFVHVQNIYSDTAYYFLTLASSPGLRVSPYAEPVALADLQIENSIGRAFTEKEDDNLVGSGRKWYGEYFDITTSFNFTFSMPSLDMTKNSWVKVSTVARSGTTSRFDLNYPNGTLIGSWNHAPISGSSGSNYVTASEWSGEFLPSSANQLIMTLNYEKLGNPSAAAWLDYIVVNGIQDLNFSGSQFAFRYPVGMGAGLVAEYRLNSANNTTIWDITDPLRPTYINKGNSGATSVFRALHDTLKEFIAFAGNSFPEPASYRSVQNQDLHGMLTPQVLIICPPSLRVPAEALADIHRDQGWTSEIVSTTAIYNEFGSGAQDLAAIRDFLRMHYLRNNPPSEKLIHVVLYGDASYDYKDRVANNTNQIPTWQSEASFSLYSSWAMDDFMFMLDDLEGSVSSLPYDDVDLSFGRIVVNTTSEANAVNAKIQEYIRSSNSGEWINDILFVADDVDQTWETILMTNADELATLIDTTYPRFNIDKIYMDAFVQQATPAGQRYPGAKQALWDRVEKGVMLVNYIGHGGELGWAHERVLENSDILRWTNFDRLTNFLTVTCEFSRYDDPKRVSAGEYCLLNPNGAGVSLFSTSRVVYVGPAHSVNQKFYDWAFEKVNGHYLTNGEIMMYTKNSLVGYTRQVFAYFGDPCTEMPHPSYRVVTTEFKEEPVTSVPDTINALSLVKVKGEVLDPSGQKNFNGELVPTVFDKSATEYTRANNGIGPNIPFELQKNIIYKGRVTVSNGEWSFEFVVPKDIAYQIDYGRISYFGKGLGEEMAEGHYDNFLVGGTNPNPATDEEGPSLQLFMNDESFVYGGTTDENPEFLAVLSDVSGINTLGNGIGHDLVAILDGNTNEPYVLNDYYTADIDEYQSGRVSYPFFELEPGRHHIQFKAFDTYNNSSESEIEFVVAESAEIALAHVLNYPNPFTTYTEFHFEHNRPGELLEVQVQIMTISGQVVKTINTQVQTDGFRVDEITWDGRDDFGDRIGKGTYVYKVEVRSKLDNSRAEKFEKLVILQ